jgi:hypothetical protein
MLMPRVRRGSVKPPAGAIQLDWAHPFLKHHLLSVLFDGTGALPAWLDWPGRPSHPGATTGGPTVITSGHVRPRASTVYDPFDAIGTGYAHNMEGRAWDVRTRFNSLDLGESTWFPTKNVTLCLIRRALEPLSGAASGSGRNILIGQGNSARYCRAYVPWNGDGRTYFEFGGTSGAHVLSVSNTISTTVPERYVFVAGDSGLAIWKNGVKIASSSSATSRSASTTSSTDNLYLNGLSSADGLDRAEYNFFMVVEREWPEELCRWWSAEPYAHLYAESTGRRWFVPSIVSVVDDVVDDARFTLPGAWAGVEGPIYWTTLAHRDADGNPKRFPWAPISVADPASYYDGFKEARILSTGEISCPLSDRYGRLQVPICEVRYSDLPGSDGLMLLRGMLGRDTQRALRGKEFTIYAITDRDRRQAKAPIIVFRGYVDRCAGPADYQFSITAKGWIAKRLRAKLWEDTIVDVFPSCPAAVRSRALPLALGHLSDERSAELGVEFVADEAGRGGAGGANPISSYGDIGLAAPTPLAVTAVPAGGSLPAGTYGVFATRVVAGIESDPEPFLPGDATPITADDGDAISATCDADGADAYRFYFFKFAGSAIDTHALHVLETTDPVTGVLFTDYPPDDGSTPITPGAAYGQSPFGYVSVMAVMPDGRTPLSPGEFPNLAFVQTVGYHRPVRLAWTPKVDAVAYEVYFRTQPTGPNGEVDGSAFTHRFDVPADKLNGNGDVYWEWLWDDASAFVFVNGAPIPQGVIPPIFVGKFIDAYGFGEWYGFLISARPCFEFESALIGGERVSDDKYGLTIVARGKPGYEERFGAGPYTVGDYQLEMVFLLGDLATRALGLSDDPAEPFRVNVKGLPNAANDDCERSIYEQFRLLAKNCVLSDAPAISGAFDQEPVFSDDTPRLDDASVDQAADDALAAGHSPDAARWLLGSMTVDQFFADWCPSARAKVGIKPNGQTIVCVHNPLATPAAAIDELEIIDQSFAFEATDHGFANAVPFAWRPEYDAAGGVSLREQDTAEDLDSQAAYGERVEDDDLALTWRTEATLARAVAEAFLAESAYLPQPARAESVLHWLHRSPGDVVAVTHRQGAAGSGYQDRKHAVLGMMIDLDQCRVGLNLLALAISAPALAEVWVEFSGSAPTRIARVMTRDPSTATPIQVHAWTVEAVGTLPDASTAVLEVRFSGASPARRARLIAVDPASGLEVTVADGLHAPVSVDSTGATTSRVTASFPSAGRVVLSAADPVTGEDMTLLDEVYTV